MRTLAITLALLALGSDARSAEVYQTSAAFIAEVFPEEKPMAKAVWLTGKLEDEVEHVLGHRYGDLRVRYWAHGDRRAWILEEVGKVEPITLGVVVKGGQIEAVRVLTYRESRGWEIRFPFFMDQYRGARFDANTNELDRKIDGISGATLSVRAATRVARLALVLDQAVDHIGDTIHSKAP